MYAHAFSVRIKIYKHANIFMNRVIKIHMRTNTFADLLTYLYNLLQKIIFLMIRCKLSVKRFVTHFIWTKIST